ncbi:TetR/AcrR family transcriptional regulator [Streptomyces olindensis]|uniref:TetR/AcrR family transcriptional regulator n=1 Tax=Streptomyces olindensis TaxID=358823 RepID=UPI0036AFF36F
METSGVNKRPSGDRRVRRTQATLHSALIELVAGRDLAHITVADVAERADINRSTFYAHYQDVHELAEAACTAMIDDLIASLPEPDQVSSDPKQGVTESMRQFFARFGEHANLYRSLLGPQGSARIIDYVRRRVTEGIHASTRPTHPGDEIPPGASANAHDVSAAFVAGALVGVAIDWLQRGCPQSPAEMAALVSPPLMGIYEAPADRR